MSALTVVENEPRKAPLMAGARPSAIVPNSMEDAYRIAVAVCNAGMAPKGLDEPNKALVAIMHGLEVGLTPMAALQRIAVVNGRPTIWGDGAIGLVRGSGACEFIHESISGDGEAMVARCEAKRRGEAEPIIGEFSVADAKKAGLWGKAGPWTQYPKRMLQMRARAFALRDGFADVLGGLHVREEIEEETRDQRRPPAPPPAIEHKPAVAPVEEKREPIAAETQRRRPPTPPQGIAEGTINEAQGFAGYKLRVVKMLNDAPDAEACDKVFEAMVTKHMGKLKAPEYEELSAALESRLREFEPQMVWGE